MPTIDDRKKMYADRAARFGAEAEKFRKLVRNTNLARGGAFLLGVAAALVAASYSLTAMWVAIAVAVVLFLFFVKLNVRYETSRDYNKTMERVNTDELNALGNNYSGFDGGKDFVDGGHSFSYDLDIFGNNSIFQMVNRTCTGGGKKILAEMFANPLTDIAKIREIQRDSQLWADELELRQIFRAYGLMYDYKGNDRSYDFDGVNYFFTKTIFWRVLSLVLTVATCSAIVLACAGVCSGYVGLGLYLVQNFVVMLNVSKTNALSKILDKGSKVFFKYGMLLEILERLPEKPQKYAKITDGHVSVALRQLSKIAALYEQRSNMLLFILGEGILSYDIMVNIKFENYLRKYSGEFQQWFDAVHQCDYLMSLANLRYNHPGWCVPEPVEGSFKLDAKAAGHPLIAPDKLVCNDIHFSDRTFLTILTGANMAGKSTYLRTIGVNLVLAHIGAVACAEEFVFSPTEIMTSIRTTDSVQDNESYFFAELKRLQKIVNRLEAGVTLFIIVDEMLRGTNSKDKHDGSQKFIQKLLNYKCYGIFATHDIDIGNLRDSYPDNVNAKCFEISFEGDNLIFDYKLKDGISQNLNASYLMKKMGIIE